MTLTPAYGRDYKSKKELLADFDNDKDFIYNTYCGQAYANKTDLVKEGMKTIQARYGKLRKSMMITIK